jgi:hypothetical protein
MPDGAEGQRNPEQQAREAPSQLDRQMVKWTRAVAIFTGLLFIASAVGNYFIYGQYQALNDQLRDSREQLRASVTNDQ